MKETRKLDRETKRDFRMTRKKLDNGGGGDAHHRHTFDRVCMTNSFVNASSVKRYDSVRGIALNYPISFVSFFLRFTTKAAEPSGLSKIHFRVFRFFFVFFRCKNNQ